jgi:hypothetical protein
VSRREYSDAADAVCKPGSAAIRFNTRVLGRQRQCSSSAYDNATARRRIARLRLHAG